RCRRPRPRRAGPSARRSAPCSGRGRARTRSCSCEMNTARLTALARKYMAETVTFTRVTGHGAGVATIPVGAAAPGHRVLKGGSQPIPLPGGSDAVQLVRFVVDSAEDIRPRDLLVDATGQQYRIVGVQRLLAGLPLQLDCVGVLA